MNNFIFNLCEFYWRVCWRFKEWKFKRKYGMTMDDAMKEYGKNIIIHEKKTDRVIL